MRLKLGRKLYCPRGNGQYTPVQVRELRSRAEISSYLEPERRYAVTGIAYLEPNVPETSCRWFVATCNDHFALCLIVRNLSPNYMMTLGDESMLDSLLQSIRLPSRTVITCKPEHLHVIGDYFELEWQSLVKRMVVTGEAFNPVEKEALQLRPAHASELNSLYGSAYSGNFTPAQIRRGVFYGIWRDGLLVAVAGTHLVAPTNGIAYLGNVMTHPLHRNEGLATICASAVTTDLLEDCTEVVLNVEPQNLPAVRAYTNLGYNDDCMVIEALGHRRRFAGVIITNIGKRLGLIPNYKEGVEVDG